jgi:hypothetical protein
MRPFVYRCPSTDIPVITQLYAGMFLDDGQFPFPYPCPCGHLHTLEVAEKEIVVTDTQGELPPAVTPLLPIQPAREARR